MEVVRPSPEVVLRSVADNLRLGAPMSVLPANSLLQMAQDQAKKDLGELEEILSLCSGVTP